VLRPITRTAADHRCLVGLLIASLEMPVRRRRATTVGQGAQTRPLSATNSLRGGRAWWAHFEFTRINTAPTFLRKKIEEQLNFGASCASDYAGRSSESHSDENAVGPASA